jgi:RNA polymerase sigma-70 factor (ECF subfamily)
MPADLRSLLEAGDIQTALRELHRAHAAEVDRFVRYCARPGAPIDDICQEVWAAVREALPKFRFAATPRVWLFAIARRKAADAFRGAGRDVTLDSELVADGFATICAPPETPSRMLHVAQRARTLSEALGALTAEERELLELRFVAGLKPAQIVKFLGLSAEPNTVSQRIVRLVRRLRERLRGRSALDSYRS